jgi:hypothetical protein
MEGVLSQPALLARLEAPDDPAAWQFVPPGGIERLESCPPTLSCRSGGEYFRTTWLEAQGEAGPLGDSVAQMPSAPVYAQQGDQARFAGFCGVPDGAARTMLLLPGMGSKSDVSLPAFFEMSDDAGVEAPAMTLEQQHVLAWAVRMGAPVYLEPCEHLQEFLPLALALEPQESDGELRVLVDLAAAGDPNAITISADGGVPVEGIQRAVAVEGLAGSGLAGQGGPIVHDWSCPGNYVMGTVVNRDGAPMADVRLAMTDGWGNQTIAVSKNGPSDYGMFDFPIYGDGPQNLQLVVVDENNNPRSAPVIVPHKMDAASDTPCHHVVIRGD